jgi:hypothetical protein
MASASIFPRTGLAGQLVGQILHTSPTSASTSGIFLAAPRRTGKSTFVREDLRPELQRRGALVIYADLWADRSTDPSKIMATAIHAELVKHGNVVAKLARAIGITGGKVGGVDFSIDRVGVGKDVHLTAALVALSDEVKIPIVVIIDEAQHALTSAEGVDSLFALKAARDELNSSAHWGLRLVCTGSNRDKLAMLRNSKDQAFFGAPLVNFPHLGRDYIDWFCKNVALPAQLHPDLVWPLFERAGFRPELLGAAADALRFDFTLEARDVARCFTAAVDEQIAAARGEVIRVIHGLTPLQAAVLRVLSASGIDYRPFEAQTLERYRETRRQAGQDDGVKIDVPAVQSALLALQEKALVWRAARGVYALEDAALQEVLRDSP